MNRGAWRATVHGIARVRHNLATQHPGFGPITILISGQHHLFSRLC